MKTKISKSEVMKEAWSLYRLFNRINRITKKPFGKIIRSFSYCLKRAWEMVKLAASKPKPIPVSAEFIAGAEEYYRENHRYYGD